MGTVWARGWSDRGVLDARGMYKLNAEEIKMLAKTERDMDAGVLPFVMLNGHRVRMDDAGMKHFGLEQGQTINQMIFVSILEFNLAECERKIAEQNALKN